MTTQAITMSPPIGAPPERLVNGDRMTREEFHALYQRTPKHFKAELIQGEVFVASPMKNPHSENQSGIAAILLGYENKTPGVVHGLSGTIILEKDNEPQPDFFVRVLEGYGGRSTLNEDEFIEGPPEFVGEISDTSRSIDLNRKRVMYRELGVLEYLVVDIRDRRLHWFDLQQTVEPQPIPDGIVRLRTFPGLWIDAAALFDRSLERLLATMNLGLATHEHAAFVAQLAAART